MILLQLLHDLNPGLESHKAEIPTCGSRSREEIPLFTGSGSGSRAGIVTHLMRSLGNRFYLKQAKMSVVAMSAVDTMEGFTCTAMLIRGPRPRPAKKEGYK